MARGHDKCKQGGKPPHQRPRSRFTPGSPEAGLKGVRHPRPTAHGTHRRKLRRLAVIERNGRRPKGGSLERGSPPHVVIGAKVASRSARPRAHAKLVGWWHRARRAARLQTHRRATRRRAVEVRRFTGSRTVTLTVSCKRSLGHARRNQSHTMPIAGGRPRFDRLGVPAGSW